MNAAQIVEAILMKYSSPEHDETHCRMSELRRDLVRVIEGYERQRDDIQEMHDAWLRVQRLQHEGRSWLQRLFA